MKNLILIFVILIGVQSGKAQEFASTTAYTIIEDIPDKGQDYLEYQVHLVAATAPSTKLASFTISEPELFETIQITTLEQPGLEDVSEIVKVEVEYLGCCAHVEAYYFLATTTLEFVALPRLENVYCDTTNSEQHYTFPNQNYGVANNILNTETMYTEMGAIQYVRLKRSYAWKDDDFENTIVAEGASGTASILDHSMTNYD